MCIQLSVLSELEAVWCEHSVLHSHRQQPRWGWGNTEEWRKTCTFLVPGLKCLNPRSNNKQTRYRSYNHKKTGSVHTAECAEWAGGCVVWARCASQPPPAASLRLRERWRVTENLYVSSTRASRRNALGAREPPPPTKCARSPTKAQRCRITSYWAKLRAHREKSLTELRRQSVFSLSHLPSLTLTNSS